MAAAEKIFRQGLLDKFPLKSLKTTHLSRASHVLTSYHIGIFKNLCDAHLHHWAFELPMWISFCCFWIWNFKIFLLLQLHYGTLCVTSHRFSHPAPLKIYTRLQKLYKMVWALVVSYPLTANLCRTLNLFAREESARFLIKPGNDWCSVLQSWHSSKNWVVGVPASLLGNEQDRGLRGQSITQLDFRRQILH